MTYTDNITFQSLTPYPKITDLTGRRFTRLLVLGFLGKDSGRISLWLCQCDCGKQITATSGNLNSGSTKSCKCLRRESPHRIRHGMSRSPEYHAWQSMIERCYTRTNQHFPNYGKRGITVCDRWRNSFTHFYADMGKRPSPQHSLDRRDNNGHYEPKNCRWATINEQNNNKRDNRHITWRGKTQTLKMWSSDLRIQYPVLSCRLNHLCWPVDRAFTTPVKVQKNHKPYMS